MTTVHDEMPHSGQVCQVKGGSLGSPREVQFGVHVGQVILDRFVAEAEFCRDFLIGFSLRNKRKQALFLRRQQMPPPLRLSIRKFSKIGKGMPGHAGIEI